MHHFRLLRGGHDVKEKNGYLEENVKFYYKGIPYYLTYCHLVFQGEERQEYEFHPFYLLSIRVDAHGDFNKNIENNISTVVHPTIWSIQRIEHL